MSENLLSEINLDSFRERFIKYTRKAFQMLPKLEKPRILDIGCGSGLPTLELAELSGGEVIGLDIDQTQLEKLNRKIVEQGLSHRVKTIKCSIVEMAFPDEHFNILWAEGVLRVMGFEKSLKEWHRLLKPNGFLVVHDAISIVVTELEKIPRLGYKLIDSFSLPEDSWWTECYYPLEIRIKKLSTKYQNNVEAIKILEKYQNEINMVKRNREELSSAFYIMQKPENLTR